MECFCVAPRTYLVSVHECQTIFIYSDITALHRQLQGQGLEVDGEVLVNKLFIYTQLLCRYRLLMAEYAVSVSG